MNTAVTTTTPTKPMTAREAFARAVEYADLAAESADLGYIDHAQATAAVAQAYAAIATARGSVKADSPWWAAA